MRMRHAGLVVTPLPQPNGARFRFGRGLSSEPSAYAYGITKAGRHSDCRGPMDLRFVKDSALLIIYAKARLAYLSMLLLPPASFIDSYTIVLLYYSVCSLQ